MATIKVGDTFNRIRDIAKVFGIPLDRIQMGFQYKGSYPCPGKEDKYLVWWPRSLYGKNYKGPWMNAFNADNTEIRERHLNGNGHRCLIENELSKAKRDIKRVVFKQVRCNTGYCYKFIGVYKKDADASKEEYVLVHRRIPGIETFEV